MNAGRLITVDTDTLTDLRTYLHGVGSDLSLHEVASQAIRAWLAGQAAPSDAGPFNPDPNDAGGASTATVARASGARGYQWKELFLPEGTDVRMSYKAEVYQARVTGDAIMYQGLGVSPRQLTIAIAGDGRNAWRDLSLRLPGEKHFRPACLLRRNLRAKLDGQRKAGCDPATESPAAAIAAAAASMSEALRTALALVEHSNAQAVPKYERRGDRHRRAADVMGEHAAYD
jgi:hypothetical protein